MRSAVSKILIVLLATLPVTATAIEGSARTVAKSETQNVLRIRQIVKQERRDRVLSVADLGCWSAPPENSLDAMRNCILLGVDVGEIDVHLTKDPQLVVFHDRDLSRMTNGRGQIWGAKGNNYMVVGVMAQWSAGLSDDVALGDPDLARGRLIDLGVHSIMTYRPEQLVTYLKGRGLR